MAHYDVFRDQLGVKYPGYGHALWEPNPGLYSPTEVGDVGFIREGKFHRLFNALFPADHPSHERFGVPEDHEPLLPGATSHIDTGTLSPNNFCSYEVTVASGEFEMFANEPVDIPDISFSCSRKGGAVLSLPVAAQREDTIARGDFGKWILKHIDSWLAFTQRLGLGIDKMGDIILVTGRHRTRSWTNVAFFESQANGRASFGVKITNDVSTRVNWSVSHERIQGAVLSQGPSGAGLPEDQCIFVRGYRVARTFKLFPRLKGAAGDTPDPSGHDCEPELEVVSLPSFTEYRDPLHVLLEYIAERAPGCDFALVHDDDLDRIRRIGDWNSLESLQPDAVVGYLRSSEPEITQVVCSTHPKGSFSSENGTVVSDTGGPTMGVFSEELRSWDRPISTACLSASFTQDSTGTELPHDSALTRTGPPADSDSIIHKPYQSIHPSPDQLRPLELYSASATSSHSMGMDQPTFVNHYFKNVGRAYRQRMTTLIEMCRLYVDFAPQTYTEDDRFQNILGLADAALSAAGRANKGATSEATESFLRVQKEMTRFGSPPPNNAPAPHRKILRDLGTAMEAASKRDEKSTSFIAKVKAIFPSPDSKGPIRKVDFVFLKSPHERHCDLEFVHQEIDKYTTFSEIIWRFSRYPENNPKRITLKQNPRFYIGLSDDATSYGSDFHNDPLKDFAYAYQGRTSLSTIYVLSDKSCRLYLDAAPPHESRIFTNLWRPHGTIILKDVCGILDSEDRIPFSFGESQDYWYRPSKVVDPSQRHVESGYSDVDNIIIQKPVGNWHAVLESALVSQNIDLLIRDLSMPEPPAEWQRLPSDTYPRLEPTDTSTFRSGDSIPSPASTVVDLLDPSLLTPVASEKKIIQPGNSSKDLLVKVSDIPHRPTPTAPAGYSKAVPLPLPEQEMQDADPVGRKGKGRRKVFDAYAIQDS